ncbi:hypothetical protein T484DRAFT_2418631 [Baffinella frigidus]|nr:hypothetical protein T484DRAFT_2418631 [Cryptophyta sp. CCMP2293]
MRGVGAISHRALESYSDAGLDARARGALMRHADTHHRAGAGQADFKLNLSHAELATCVGEEAARRLDGLFRGYGGKDYTIVVRRVEAVAGGRCIAFHTDGSTPHTLQVRLSRESDYDGGQLVFATEEGLVATSRKAGSATLHDSSIAHGVSLHTRGVRHSLFFLDSHIDLPRAASEPAGPPE